MSTQHVVWDWNGTLLDDLTVVIEALNIGIGKFGHDPIDEDEYRTHFTRPVRAFYDSLLARPVSDMEWEALNNTFHDEYFDRVHRAKLTSDALPAMEMVDEAGWGQSLLSMTTHHKLVEIVSSHGLIERFSMVDGLRIGTGGLKAQHLEEHLEALGIAASATVVIGDTPDDATAARHVGADVILYDGGSHHLLTLEQAGAPIAHSLTQAVEWAMT